MTQRMRWIPPGRFLMGSPLDEGGRLNIEGPRHEVVLTKGFWLANTTCTQALWMAVVGHNPSRFQWDKYLPVENVSWKAINELFIAPLIRDFPGFKLFLPTEAQWEYACRAGTSTAYEFGAIFNKEKAQIQGGGTAHVNAFSPNRWGLYQMHGNVWEWCSDTPRIYTNEKVVDPVGGQGFYRVLRGGAWNNVARSLRSGYRRSESESDSYRHGIFGFRFALGVDAA